MRAPNPYILVLAVSAVLILQVAFARDVFLQKGYGDEEAPSAFVARVDLLLADVLLVALVFLIMGTVRDYIAERRGRHLARAGVLGGLFMVLGAFHPTLFTRAPYEELGPGNVFPLFVDLLILGGLAVAWYWERRHVAHHPKPHPTPEPK